MRSTGPAGTRWGAAAAAAVCAVLLGGCGTDSGDGGTADKASEPHPATTATATATATTPVGTAPVPRGKGSKIPDDVNGDGHPDLVYAAPCGDRTPQSKNCLVVLYGSDKGLDPARHTVLKQGDSALPVYTALKPTLADLDGDGYADIQYAASLIWGGTAGPRRDTPDASVPPGAPGDFDHDGHTDLAVVEIGRTPPAYRFMYGPFDRAGKPARWSDSHPSPFTGATAQGPYGVRAGDTDGDDVSDLVATEAADGEQGRSALLPDGVAPARQLRTGSAVAFGDFDGDGKGDVAVGDNGSRNDEPGYETEAPEVDGTLTVYPGAGGAPQQLNPRARGDYTTGDLDGDGRDELLIAGSSQPAVTVLHGSPQGLTLSGRSTFRRTGPDRGTAAAQRYAHLVAVRDYDGDGHAEAILRWSLSSGGPSQWWIVEDGKDVRTFMDGGITGARFH